MPLPKDKAWFPAKTYGYGWGFPSRWQGWIVMLAYVAILALSAIYFAERNMAAFLGMTCVSSLLLVTICYWKGEPAGWRWGHSKRYDQEDDPK